MTRDDIIRMAREAGFAHSWSDAAGEALERFASMVAEAEREACVRLCESGPERQESNGVWVVDHLSCAEALRARGEQ